MGSTYNTIQFEVSNGVATIAMNRPDRYNAFNEEMSFEMIDALKKCNRDDAVRVLVITGKGKAFCSGQDLKDVQGKKRSLADSVRKRYNPMIKLICNMPKPIICQLNGVAAGAGCSLALACDIIYASENASLIEVFVNVGLVLDSGSSFFLPRAVGSKRAFELATTARKMTMAEAHELGIVNKVVSADELPTEIATLAAFYAKSPTKAVGLIKKMLNKSFHSDLETMLEYEAYCQEIAGASNDYKEGVNAFVEKRKPEFTGS